MLTAVIVLLSVALVLAVGESVRGQCRRMLSRPLVGLQNDQVAAVVAAVPAEARA